MQSSFTYNEEYSCLIRYVNGEEKSRMHLEKHELVVLQSDLSKLKELKMPRIEKPNVVAFRVELTEYERGWGQKPWDTWYFDNEAEARQAAIDYNKKHNTSASAPDWYVRADYVGLVR